MLYDREHREKQLRKNRPVAAITYLYLLYIRFVCIHSYSSYFIIISAPKKNSGANQQPEITASQTMIITYPDA